VSFSHITQNGLIVFFLLKAHCIETLTNIINSQSSSMHLRLIGHQFMLMW